MTHKDDAQKRVQEFGEKIYERDNLKIALDMQNEDGAFWKMYQETYRVGTFSEDFDKKIGK